MVRRSKSSKSAEKANVVNANLEIDGFQHGLTNQSSKGKYLKPSETLSKKKTNVESVRRSQRIQNTSTSAQRKSQPICEEIVITETEEQDEDEPSGQEANKLLEGEDDSSMEEQGECEPSGQKVEKLPEPAQNGLSLEGQAGDVASDSEENDEDEPPGQMVDKPTEPAQNEPTMEEQDGDEPSGNEEEIPVVAQNEKIMEKIDYLVRLVEAQEKNIEELKAKMADKSLYSPDARYKSMYFESQKKIEVLTDDNRQMALKLENSLGKLEVYEKGQNGYSEVLDKVIDFIQVSQAARLNGVSPDKEPTKKKRKGSSQKSG